MAKRGRPYSEDPRYRQYRLRMTEGENNRLEEICKATGMKKADVLRVGIDKMYADKVVGESED